MCLTKMGFTHIIDLRRRHEIEEGDGPHEPQLARRIGLNYRNFRTSHDDAQINETRILEIVEYVRQTLAADPNANIFIHCAIGQDRTGAVIAAIVALLGGCSWQQVKAEMESFHFHPYPSLVTALVNIFSRNNVPGSPQPLHGCPVVSGQPNPPLPGIDPVCAGDTCFSDPDDLVRSDQTPGSPAPARAPASR